MASAGFWSGFARGIESGASVGNTMLEARRRGKKDERDDEEYARKKREIDDLEEIRRAAREAAAGGEDVGALAIQPVPSAQARQAMPEAATAEAAGAGAVAIPIAPVRGGASSSGQSLTMTDVSGDGALNARTHDGLPARRNADGSHSTELSITVTDPRLNGGAPTNIPSLWNGREVSEDEAVRNALSRPGSYKAFDSIDAAVADARARSAAGGAGAQNGLAAGPGPATAGPAEKPLFLPPNTHSARLFNSEMQARVDRGEFGPQGGASPGGAAAQASSAVPGQTSPAAAAQPDTTAAPPGRSGSGMRPVQSRGALEKLGATLMAQTEKAIQIGRPDLALQYHVDGMKVREQLRSEAFDKADAAFRVSQDPNVWVGFFNRYVGDSFKLDGIQKAEGGGYVISGRNFDGERFNQPMSDQQVAQYVQFIRDPKAARAMEVKQAETLAQKGAEMRRNAVATAASDTSDAGINTAASRMVQQGLMDRGEAQRWQQRMLAVTDPRERQRILAEQARTPEQLADAYKPKMEKVDDGQTIRHVDVNPLTGGQQAPVQRQMTPGEVASNRIAAGNLAVSQDNLAVNQGRLRLDQEAPRGTPLDTANGPVLVDPRSATARPITDATGKPVPAKLPESARKEIDSLDAQAAAVQSALDSVRQTPSAFSMQRGLATLGGTISESVAGRMDSEGEQKARAFVFNNVSKIINERAGAAQSAQELARLRSFLPAETDNDKQVTAKLQAFQEYLRVQRDTFSTPVNQRQPGATQAQPQQRPQQGSQPVRITSDADFSSLPSGALFVGPDGKTRRKP